MGVGTVDEQGRARRRRRPVPRRLRLRPARLLAFGVPAAVALAFGGPAGAGVVPVAGESASTTLPSWAGLTGTDWTTASAGADEHDYDSSTVAFAAPAFDLGPDGSSSQWWGVGGPGTSQVGYAPGLSGSGGSFGSSSYLASGVPMRAYQAYVAAAGRIASTDPGCRLPWWVLAGIGRVESNHGRYGGSVVTTTGRVVPSILGIRLDGTRPGTATIRDSDGGAYDGDAAYDRAVGPMQFLPGTWERYGADADGDGRADPQDVDDAAYGAARYLCAGGGDLSTDAGRVAAVLRYNHSMGYVRLVLATGAGYASGVALDPTPAPYLPPDRVTVDPTPTGTRSPSGTPTTTRPTTSRPTTSSPTTGSPTTGSPTTGSPTTGSPTTGTPTDDPTTSTPTETPTGTGSPTSEPCPTDTATATPDPTDTATPTQSPTPDPCATGTPTGSPTATDSPTATESPSATETATATATETASATESATTTATATQTRSATETATATATETATATQTETATASATASPTTPPATPTP